MTYDPFEEQRRFERMLGIFPSDVATAEILRAQGIASGRLDALGHSATERAALDVARGTALLSAARTSDFLEGRGATAIADLEKAIAMAVGTSGAFTTSEALRTDHGARVGAFVERYSREAHGLAAHNRPGSLAMTATEVARGHGFGLSLRAAHWATGLDRYSAAAIGGAFGASDAIAKEVAALSRLASGMSGSTVAASFMTGGRTRRGGLEATSLKMSTFAGALDVFGPGSAAGQSAYEALLGRWRTDADLPPAYWRDRATRSRMYREAEVDPGLVEAENAAVVDVLVEAGVVEGERTADGVKAIVEVGPLRMAITTRRARHDAQRVIDAFEVALRAFIARKLEAHMASTGGDPGKWFAQRVPGDISGRAKDKRRVAYGAGEEKQPLINFTDIGELIAVITSSRNWDEVFGAVFSDRDGIKVDVRRLNAHRRPAMHSRPIDGPRLAEIVLTVRRLVVAMEQDGAWDAGWDDDA